MKNKYEVGDLLFDEVEKTAYLILEIVYPFSKTSPYYNVLSLDKNEDQKDECICVNYIDNDPDIYKCETEKEMVVNFVEARKEIESYLEKQRNVHDVEKKFVF